LKIASKFSSEHEKMPYAQLGMASMIWMFLKALPCSVRATFGSFVDVTSDKASVEPEITRFGSNLPTGRNLTLF